jgi:hypothetical protein
VEGSYLDADHLVGKGLTGSIATDGRNGGKTVRSGQGQTPDTLTSHAAARQVHPLGIYPELLRGLMKWESTERECW